MISPGSTPPGRGKMAGRSRSTAQSSRLFPGLAAAAPHELLRDPVHVGGADFQIRRTGREAERVIGAIGATGLAYPNHGPGLCRIQFTAALAAASAADPGEVPADGSNHEIIINGL